MCDPFITSCAALLASKPVQSLVAPIGRQFGFVLCFKKYVEDLENRVNELDTAQRMVWLAVEAAKNNGKLIFDYIEEWLNIVKVETLEARNLLERGRSAENVCFRGWLPNPELRHPIGRKARRITKVIRNLIDKSRTFDLGNVGHERPPIGAVTFHTSPARSVDDEEDDLKSRASIKKTLLKALADDKVRVVGLWGLPGVGKSKLLDDIHKRVKKDQKPFDLIDWKPFDLVVMVKLSRNQDTRIIQEQIADQIGLYQMKEATPDGRACRIRERLERGPQKNILIIVDDLWEKLELKDVGIPCGDNNEVRGCKLLLSSRNRSVLLDYMGRDPPSLFQLKELEPDEARTLFERTAGDKVNIPRFKACVDGVIENCGGLPFTIVPLAERLKHRDLPAWRNSSTNRDLSNEKLLVESSYKGLKDERVRLLFLVCALSSGRISRRDSLLYYMGLNLLKKFSETIEKAMDQLFVDLQTLHDASLLQVESQNTEWLRMHDIIVDVAISLRDKLMDMDWSALVWRKGDRGYKECSEDDLKNCTAISFSYVGIDDLPQKLDCPNLRILLLSQGEQSLKIPDSFFDSTKKLQVLDITGLSFTSLPSSIAFLENVKSLSLDDCNLEDVTVLGKLIRLQFLSLRRSIIARLPKEIGELTELRFLDLRRCLSLKVIDPGVLGRLVNLEDLYIDSFHQWEAADESPRSNASLIELNNMKKLRTLYITIPRGANLPSDLPFANLNKHKIGIGSTRHWRGRDDESNILDLKLDSGDLLHEEWMQRCLQQTHDLHLEGSQDGEDSVHKLCIEGFQQLKRLYVQNNSTFKCIVDSTRWPAFTELESLSLENLNRLENICRGVLASESLRKLNIVKVEDCAESKHLFSSSMRRIFLQLEEIQISGCDLMEQIVADTEIDEDGDRIDDDPDLRSCKLRRLTLQNLPRMTSFYKTMDHRFVLFDAQQASFPRLESLTLAELPKLEEIWNSQYPSEVDNLKFLEVKGCTSLSSIIPSNLLIGLHNLEAITIEKCQLIREVFNLEFSENVGIMGQLTRLTLNGLPRLEHIWNKNPRGALCFQNLRALRVQNCENLRFLFSSSMAKALVQIKEIEVASCVLMEEIMDMQEEELEEVPTTDTLEFPLLNSLSLLELPNLKTFSHGKYYIHCPSLTKMTISSCPNMMTFASSEGRQQSTTSDMDLQQAFDSTNSGLSLPSFFNEKVFFPKLEELKLSSMCQLRRIWHDQLHEQSFCKLASLTVEHCENLSCVFPSDLLDRLQSLNKTEVVGCPSLEALFEPIPLNSEKRQKPWNRLLHCLESLTIQNCPRLRNLVTIAMEKNLGQLQHLILRGCREMEYIVAKEDEKPEEVANNIVTSHLVTLYLHNMPKLKSFYQGNHISKWPALKKFTIENCKAVEVILGDANCRKLEGSIPIQRPLLLVKKVEFPNMELMKISHMDNVEKIWPGELASNAFTKLKILVVEHCKKLSSLFSSHTILTRFRNLKELIVTNSGSLEVVFHVQEFDINVAHSTSTFELRKIVLMRLPKLKHVWSGLPQGGLSFGCLQCMEAVECKGLKSLLPSSVAKSMTQLEELEVRECEVEEIISKEDGVRMNTSDLFFPQLTDLILLELPKLRYFYKYNHTSTWPLLKRLWVRNCGEMRTFSFAGEFQSYQGTTTSQNQPALFSFEKVIPRLEKLILTRENFVEVPMTQHHSIFGSLRELVLSCYHGANVSFPSNFLLQSFPNLQQLTVACSSFEEIFPENASGLGGATPCGGLTDVENPLKALANLERLDLSKVCNLRRVWKDGSLMAEILNQIKYLFVWKCPSLSIIFPTPTSFQRLWKLEIEDCAGLVHMGTCSAVTSLVHLTWLTLRNCGALEDVVKDDGNGAKEISFPELEELILDGLPSLESFSPANCAFRFPALDRIVVKQCPKMNKFCKGALRTPNLDKVLLSNGDDEWRWEGDLDTTIRTLST